MPESAVVARAPATANDTGSLVAAVDLGSNSFRLQVARVVEDQIYPLDSLREPVRLAAGLSADKRLDELSQQRALETLQDRKSVV